MCILAGVLFGTGAFGKKSSAVQKSAAPSAPAAEKEEEKAEEVICSGDFKTVGSVVTFGSYEQDNDTSNGKEPIEWIVLDVQDGKSLLISKYALDCQAYNTRNETVTWVTCSLRTWLNGTFLKDAFNTEEQARIPTVAVTADANPDYTTGQGRETQDRIFLLSIQEAEKYFDSDGARQCKPTANTIAHGCPANSTYDGACWWWLRSLGRYSNYAAGVNDDGSIHSNGRDVYRTLRGVRPALWINLTSASSKPVAGRPEGQNSPAAQETAAPSKPVAGKSAGN